MDKYRKYYLYGLLALGLGIAIAYVSTGSDPISDIYVIGIGISAFASFYLVCVGTVHFTGWALGELGYGKPKK